MGIHQLNHAVLYVSDLERSVAFYRDVLGFRPAGDVSLPGAAFLVAPGSTNDHDLGLFEAPEVAQPVHAARTRVGLYHLAWEVDTLGDLQELVLRLREAGALTGASDHGTSKSLYARDPDGLDFEVVWLVPADRIDAEALASRSRIGRLDLQAEIERHGIDTPGGIGISR